MPKTIRQSGVRRPVFDSVSGTLGAALSRAGHNGELTVHSDQGRHYKMQPYRTMDLTRFHRQISASSTKLLEHRWAQKVKMTVPADSIVETLDVIEHI